MMSETTFPACLVGRTVRMWWPAARGEWTVRVEAATETHLRVRYKGNLNQPCWLPWRDAVLVLVPAE